MFEAKVIMFRSSEFVIVVAFASRPFGLRIDV